METIYERIAVCSDATWNALSGAEQAEFDDHFTTWAGYLASTKSDLVAINAGCREVVIWGDESMPLARYAPTAAERGTEDANNYNIFRAHESARHGGIPGSGIQFDGFNTSSNYTHWIDIEFDQSLYSDTTYGYFCDCYAKNHKFTNCIFKDLYSGARTSTYQWFKNCLFINFQVYMSFVHGAKCYNCGFYTTTSYTQQRVVYGAECYNCWAHGENRTGGYTMFYSCTGSNNYATDGSEPVPTRTINSFGFTDPSNFDFSITSSSPLFDRGISDAALTSEDIDGLPREQGAAPDIGPYEVPVLTSVTLSGVVIGSVCSIVDMDNGGFLVSPFAADETTETMEFSLIASTNVSIRVRNASGATKYLPWKTDFLLTPAGTTLYVSQTVDTIAS